MLDIYMRDKKYFVTLDQSHEHYGRAYIILKSMLTTKEQQDGRTFSIGYEDLPFLRKKMISFGLLPYCTITEEAHQFGEWLQSCRDYEAALKSGSHDAQTLSLLEGKLKNPLYADQVTAVSYLLYKGSAGLFDDMGSGKTLISLAVAAALGDQVRRTLVICPHNVIFGFLREINKHTYFKGIAVPSGRKTSVKFLQDAMQDDWDFLLVHPENLIGIKKDVYGSLTEFLSQQWFDMIISDEFHMYKNLSAKRTKCVLKLMKDIRNREGGYPRCIPMTGTPISETPVNAYTILRLLSFDQMPHITRFENYYCEKRTVQFGKGGPVAKKVVGFKNLDELKARIEHVSIRRTKDDMKGFPDKIEVIRDIELTGRQKVLYKAICGEVVAELGLSTRINLMSFLQNSNSVLRLRQLMNHPNLLNEEGESAKYKEIDLILDELFTDPEAKAVIWTAYRQSAQNLYERYKSLYGAVKIIGGMNEAVFERTAYEFENQDAPRVAVCTAEKAGTGTDFLARARTAIYTDRPHSYVLYKQSMDRIHRRVTSSNNPNQLDRIRAQPATLIFLDVVNSVDALVRDQLMGKQDVAQAMTTGNQKLVEIGRADLLKYFKL